jgi:hypothetical protein
LIHCGEIHYIIKCDVLHYNDFTKIFTSPSHVLPPFACIPTYMMSSFLILKSTICDQIEKAIYMQVLVGNTTRKHHPIHRPILLLKVEYIILRAIIFIFKEQRTIYEWRKWKSYIPWQRAEHSDCKEERKLKLLPQTSNERKVKWKQDI